MNKKTSISVELHSTARRYPFDKKKFFVELDKPEFFKYAIYQMEVPGHIKESDFDYLQSKAPFLESLNNDYLELTQNTIINLCKDDTTQ
ncbi:hypothetical protein [[Flexibacter] sp. ATCC 35208]|uniref:hypothetical protein n=1 Tax=[Flexibacter] sp. ATCC 35208 TaxID=1936242 RepID=UPI0009D3FF44|nr:hypothetical protein [[Flexibacter] sp. ATCC 35208]OMP75283.1 hypothetical protein BW716_30860 [[Flexibacter] sp. ATCC 35208]